MKSVETLLQAFLESQPNHAARAFETIETDEKVQLLGKIPELTGAGLLERLAPHSAADLLVRLDELRAVSILQQMSLRAAAVVCRQLDPAVRDGLLGKLPADRQNTIRELTEYPPESAGSLMQTKVVSLLIDLTAEQAISEIRRAPRDALHYLYVSDRTGELAGVLNMRDLMLAEPNSPIEPLVRRNVLTVPATMGGKEVFQLMRDQQFLALPVVDLDGKLVGVVQQQSAMKVARQEAFENLQKMVGGGGDERALSPVSIVIRRRLPWLLVNLVTAFAAAAVVGLFEGTIQQVTALAILLPIVSGQGGNSGSQSLAVVIRGLALRELISGSSRRVVIKELCAGAFNGVVVAIVTAAAVWMWSGNNGLALVIGVAMVINMVAAAGSGAVIPLILKRLGRDPAQSAAIFLTTVTDIVGFASFLGLAMLFMKWLK